MNVIKKTVLAIAAAALVIMPVATNAANDVRVETQTDVRNTTTNTPYADSTSAVVDEVVAVQVWYHNMEDENSGLVANDLKVKIDLPQNQPGKTQTVTGTVSGANFSTVADNATINLSHENAFLEYIPGSAEWRHNAGTNDNPNFVTEKIGDEVVTGGGVVVENAQPCFNFEATVTILVRVKGHATSITKQARKAGTSVDFQREIAAKPGEEIEFVITVKNQGNTRQTGVVVGDNLPPHMEYIPGSTRLVNSNTGSGGMTLNDDIVSGGVTIDNMAVGATQYVFFKVKINEEIPCGPHTLQNVGIVKSNEYGEIYNVAEVKVEVPCGGGQPPKEQPPVEQPEIPRAGAGTAAAGLVGMSALGYVTQAYLASKRTLLSALKR